ncbi:uncharacterized protein HMPREF1120_00621 [Exophiala dermatitidis NIH/UT8656]|uniref:Uncharacterized protein n=2 Tax=Exophiala dermatitidis TaxID=5970 RepID=H6BNZ0_EXODN|nr:uncharacterized protein HMPREF1120_00621 [Exophiala dermatitidis NIH/UT8656]EHY52408.1 hypothetical protein HMPREF1120_00621 [Exophiala dermatitidis NIH/UT8656]
MAGDYPRVLRKIAEGQSASIQDVKWAIRQCPAEILSALLDSGVDINQPINAWNPPPLALTFHDPQLTRLFLSKNADPNAQCRFDMTPLSVAVLEASLEIIQLLFDHGASCDYGQPLHWATRRSSADRLDVAQSLLLRGARINEIEYQSHPTSFQYCDFMALGTPLHGAAERGDAEMVEFLLNNGADATIRDTFGERAIERAARNNHPEVVRLLNN